MDIINTASETAVSLTGHIRGKSSFLLIFKFQCDFTMPGGIYLPNVPTFFPQSAENQNEKRLPPGKKDYIKDVTFMCFNYTFCSL